MGAVETDMPGPEGPDEGRVRRCVLLEAFREGCAGEERSLCLSFSSGLEDSFCFEVVPLFEIVWRKVS